MEKPLRPESNPSVSEIYQETLERARKQVPALIKRMSNTIPEDQTAKLVDPTAEEFNPDFSYPAMFDLNEDEIQSRLDTITDALSKLELLESQGFKPTINDELDKEKAITGSDNLRMLEIVQKIHMGGGDKVLLESELMALNEKMTGQIEPDLYQGIVNSIHDICEQLGESQPIAKKIASELAAMIPDISGNSRVLGLPEKEFMIYKDAYNAIFGAWLNRILPFKEGVYTPSEMAEVFSSALLDMGLDKIGWRVKLDDAAPSLKISMEDQLITVPTKREALTHPELAARLVHEFGHVARGLNGSYISRSAEHGLPDYLDAEEGLMAYGESFIKGKQQGNTTYIERYLGAGMVTGFAGSKHDFKDVFSSMWRTRLLFDNQDNLMSGSDVSTDDIVKAKKESLMNAKGQGLL
jgi:hypothetical protein